MAVSCQGSFSLLTIFHIVVIVVVVVVVVVYRVKTFHILLHELVIIALFSCGEKGRKKFSQYKFPYISSLITYISKHWFCLLAGTQGLKTHNGSSLFYLRGEDELEGTRLLIPCQQS